MSSPQVKRLKTETDDVISRGLQAERNVGLTEFIGKQRPFIGILKHRFEDFVVHEINPSGQMVKVTCNSQPEDLPVEEEPKEVIVEVDDLKLDQSVLDAIEAFSLNPNSAEPVLVSTDELDKEGRTKVHAYIRQKYPKLDSQTENVDGKGFIKVVPFEASNLRRRGHDRRNGNNSNKNSKGPVRWPKTTPNYVHFALYKENMETVQALNELSRRLNCTTRNFSFAGNKDKRAITTQMFAVWRTPPRAIWKVVTDYNRRSRFAVQQMHVGHFSFSPEPLKLGDLSGNHFEILLRNVRLVKEDGGDDQEDFEQLKVNVDNSLETVREQGFLNYFGMQRFGSHKVDSHKLGILILKKDFKALVEAILVERPVSSGGNINGNNNNNRFNNRFDERGFNEAIQLWKKTGDASAAFRLIPNKYTTEGSLLRAMSRLPPNDFHGALCQGLLRNSRLLYLHAYQSYIWNRVASFRYRQFGLEVVEGDLVFIGPEEEADAFPVDDELAEVVVDESMTEDADKPEAVSSNSVKANIPSEQIVLVTAENRDQFTIYDVVLPIIGGLSKLPANSTKEYIEKLLEEDGITGGMADFAALGKQWCVNGSYRKLIVRPRDYSWTWKRYSDASKPLILTDRDRLEGKTEIEEEKAVDDSKKLQDGLLISLTLPTSSYATVFLREVTKVGSLALEDKPWMQVTNDTSVDESSKGVETATV